MRTILLAILLIGGINSYSQSSWETKQLGNNLSVKFPTSPQYKLVDKTGTYISKTSQSLFLVAVQYDVLPYYTEFLKIPKNQQQELIGAFLNNAMKGILLQAGDEYAKSHSIQIGSYEGRESSFKTINPINGEEEVKFCKIVYAFNKLYIFQVMNLLEPEGNSNERNIFFNSIKVN